MSDPAHENDRSTRDTPAARRAYRVVAITFFAGGAALTVLLLNLANLAGHAWQHRKTTLVQSTRDMTGGLREVTFEDGDIMWWDLRFTKPIHPGHRVTKHRGSLIYLVNGSPANTVGDLWRGAWLMFAAAIVFVVAGFTWGLRWPAEASAFLTRPSPWEDDELRPLGQWVASLLARVIGRTRFDVLAANHASAPVGRRLAGCGVYLLAYAFALLIALAAFFALVIAITLALNALVALATHSPPDPV